VRRINKMKKFIILVILAVFITNFFGCAAFKRKFVREKKKDERPRPIVSLKDYNTDITYDDLYQKHFLFWKYWEMELIDALNEDNHKKQLLSVNQSIDNLKSLETYLVSDKTGVLVSYRQDLEKIQDKIRKGFSTGLERLRYKQEVEKHQRMLEKELMYKKMKDFIKTKEIQAPEAKQ
jgi:hypothetical protein